MAQPRPLLALDLSTHVGWAVGLPSADRPLCGVVHLGGSAGCNGSRHSALVNWLADTITTHRPARIVYESPLVAPEGRATTTALLLIGLGQMVELVCYVRDLPPPLFEHAGTVRKAVMGDGRPGKGAELKAAIVAWAEAQGWDVRGDDNAADAAMLWHYTRNKLGRTARWS